MSRPCLTKVEREALDQLTAILGPAGCVLSVVPGGRHKRVYVEHEAVAPGTFTVLTSSSSDPRNTAYHRTWARRLLRQIGDKK